MDMGVNPRHGDLVQLGVIVEKVHTLSATNRINRLARMRHITRRHPNIEHATIYPFDTERYA